MAAAESALFRREGGSSASAASGNVCPSRRWLDDVARGVLGPNSLVESFGLLMIGVPHTSDVPWLGVSR
jgi:hypothetical protein